MSWTQQQYRLKIVPLNFQKFSGGVFYAEEPTQGMRYLHAVWNFVLVPDNVKKLQQVIRGGIYINSYYGLLLGFKIAAKQNVFSRKKNKNLFMYFNHHHHIRK